MCMHVCVCEGCFLETVIFFHITQHLCRVTYVLLSLDFCSVLPHLHAMIFSATWGIQFSNMKGEKQISSNIYGHIIMQDNFTYVFIPSLWIIYTEPIITGHQPTGGIFLHWFMYHLHLNISRWSPACCPEADLASRVSDPSWFRHDMTSCCSDTSRIYHWETNRKLITGLRITIPITNILMTLQDPLTVLESSCLYTPKHLSCKRP